MTHESISTNAGPDPVTDIERLIDISGYDLESPELRARLDAIAHAAAERLGMPSAMVNIVLDSAQFAAGIHGLDGSWIAEAQGTPVEWSFCANVVRTGVPYVVPDATVDVLQQANPLVLADGLRSYAGAPVVSSAGNVLGACCVAGFEPHTFSADDIERLGLLAAEVVAELDRHRLSA